MTNMLFYFFAAVMVSTLLYVAFGILYFGLRYIAHVYRKFCGTQVVICPEIQRPAIIEVDARHAAVTAGAGHPELRVENCWRWPLCRECGQACVLKIKAAS